MGERRPTDEMLGRALGAVGRDLAYPPSPSIATNVVARLETQRAARRRPRFPTMALWSRRRTLVAVAVGILAVLTLAFAARLVLGAAEIRVRPGSSPTGPALGPGALGAPVPLDAVDEAVGFHVRTPAGPKPDAAYVFATGDGGSGALLAWDVSDRLRRLSETPWGLVLVQVLGDEGVLVKDVGRFEDARGVGVDGRRALWIDAPHELRVITDAGVETFRIEGRVLIWAEGGVTYRLETTLGLADAVALAETVG